MSGPYAGKPYAVFSLSMDGCCIAARTLPQHGSVGKGNGVAVEVDGAVVGETGDGAVLSGVIETASSGVKLVNGDIDGGEFAANVAQEAVGGYLAAAGGSAAATAAGIGAATLLAGSTAPLWVPGVVGVGAAVAAGSVVKSVWDDVAEGIRDFFCI